MIRQITKLIFFVILYSAAFAQEYNNIISVTDTFQVNLQREFHLNSIAIIPNSETVRYNKNLLSSKDYKINLSDGTITLNENLTPRLIDTLYVTYNTFKLSLRKEYKRRSLIVRYDDILNDSIRVSRVESSGFTSEAIFGDNIQKSGSIVRGFTVGTNKDFTLESGLRLQLSGNLSDEIEIVAALTDENTPIQPEGNTETLDELDKVFIEVRHPNAIGTFGDYDYTESIGEFGRITRKLQGLKGELFFDELSASGAIAGSRGKFTTNQFNGEEGNQGPYRLYGENNENNIIVIAGSERVYIDGQEMRRGENNDYTIEYANAEVTFTPNRLITSASRITIDFEYSDRQYQRNFFAGNVKTNFFEDRLKLSVGIFQESDDENNPIDISISDNDKIILENAGDDRSKAVKSGARLAQPDSTGIVRGIYEKIDTTFNGEPFTYYFYNPGSDSAIYNVSFTFVGIGQGDYLKRGLGNYEFVGIGQGSYLPIIYLPLPASRQMANILIEGRPFNNLNIKMELAGSNWDKNTFSSLDDSDNFGYARNIEIKFDPSQIEIGDLSFGKIGFNYKDRFIQDRFTAIDRIDEIEFNRNYNVVDQDKYDEELREVGLTLIPIESLNIYSQFGSLSRGDLFSSKRYLVKTNYEDPESFNLTYNLDYVSSSNRGFSTNWLKQDGNTFYKIGIVKPGLKFIHENKEDYDSNDSLMISSLRFFEYTPYIELINWGGLNMLGEYSIREESFPLDGIIQKQSDAITKNLKVSYSGIKDFNTSLNFTLRNKNYTQEFKEIGYLDSETILIRSQSRANLFDRFLDGDLFYEVSTQKSARQEKVFVLVEKGTGNYIYLGDLNNNGIKDENEFEPALFDGEYILLTVPTDELFPVIDLKTSTRWKTEFARIFKNDSFISTILNPISTETYWRVEENSKEQNTAKIYLLNFSHFLNDSTTIRGSNLLQQDIFLFKNKNDLSFRFRFTQRRNLNQFAGGTEKGFYRERGMRIRFQMVEEISNQTEYTNTIDNNSAPVTSNRARIVSTNELTSDFSYRPERNLEFGFVIKFSESRDDYPEVPTLVDANAQILRMNLNFSGRGRLRVELERNELSASSANNIIPFEITKGRVIGKNYFWRVNFDFRIAGNLQTTLNYDGRLQGAGKVIHTMRAEARAYF
ncbi:MAG: hypothetical protein M5R37_15610 [Melioribacteraceae bacterium]|nr:hypothetical protein [Melioribacteraceae bacterium]